jgi:drug/metabolite transporter (DMT)-like permease
VGGSALDVVQEKIFAPPVAIDLYAQLFWSNALSLPFYMATPLLMLLPAMGGESLSEIWQDQINAFKCTIETSPLPPNCEAGAWPWLLGFVVCYLGYFYLQSVLVKEYTAVFQAIVLTFVVPLSTVSFWFRFLVGDDVEPFSWWIIGSLGLVVLGTLLYRLSSAPDAHAHGAPAAAAAAAEPV